MRLSLAVVLPVRNAGGLLDECLRTIMPQLEAGDVCVVVDDASDDDTAAVAAAAGAEVLRRDRPGGPYAARNDGWRASTQPYVVFTDVRCRARPDWLRRIREAASEDAPALVFSDVIVASGPGLAERAAAHRQHLLARHYVQDPHFLPYFPTANLAVQRTALEAVDGFRVMPSGGDADLCWRVQLAGYDRVRGLSEPLMSWQPRATVAAFIMQWAKYGRSNAKLRLEFADRGAPIEPALGVAHAAARHGRRVLRTLRTEHVASASVVIVDGMADAAHEIEYGRTLRRLTKHGRRRA